mgnify:FL=1
MGSAADHPKFPAAGYEHIVDWFEVGRAAPTLKITEKAWEERWDDRNRRVAYPALGYFDNSQFDAGEWKTQFPYEVFDRLNAGDAVWAAKIIMSFSDDEIRAIVNTGEFSDSESEKILSEILITRRDIVGRSWFSRVTPLDEIRLFQIDDGTYEVRFADLAVKYGFASSTDSRYRLVLEGEGRSQESDAPSFSIPVSGAGGITLFIQAKHSVSGGWSEPPLKIVLAKKSQEAPFEIAQISHGI